MSTSPLSRRSLLRTGALAALAAPVAPIAARAQGAGAADRPDPWHGLKIGVASYTLRKLPVDAAVKAIQRVGLHYVSIKDSHLPLKSTPEERRSVVQKFRDGGITPLSCGVIYLPSDEPGMRAAFDYTRDCGIPTMVCSLDPAALPLAEKLVKEYDIRLAIHNHGPGDRRFETPEIVWNAVSPFDRRIGLCIDIGHTARAGVDPADAIRKYHERLYDLHLKDVTSRTAKGAPVEGGRGVMDLRAVMEALVAVRFAHQAEFEYEKDADDPLPGLAETVGYTKGLLMGIRGSAG